MNERKLAQNNVITDVFPPREVLTTFEEIKEYYDSNSCWGLLSSVDVSGCDPVLIRSADAIREYVIRMCDMLEVKRFQDAIIVNFGADEKVAGYSLVQLIETSLVSGHFANATNTAYIDIFSCKLYNPLIAAEFTKSFFGGSQSTMKMNFRY